MKHSLLLCIGLITSLFAQDSLRLPVYSSYQYLYPLTSEQVEQFLSHEDTAQSVASLGAPIDSFQKLPEFLPLDYGYYLLVNSQNHQEKRELLSRYRFQTHILNNGRDFSLAIYDSLGQPIKDAVVSLGKKNIRFNEKRQLYTLRKSYRQGLLKVEYQGYTDFYEIQATHSTSLLKRVGRRIIYSPPIRWVWVIPYHLFADPIRSIRYRYTTGWVEKVVYPFRRWGYQYSPRMIYAATSKPKYRLGDTVKVKVLVERKKGKPYTKPLDVYLYDNGTYNRGKKILSDITASSSGGYDTEFVLHDSLKIREGTNCTLQFRNIEGRQVASATFKYEDYELDGVEASFESEDKIHLRGESITLQAHLFDENKLNSPGGRVEIKAIVHFTGKRYTDTVRVPKVLWKHEQILDPIGTTSISLSDSLFPAADLIYSLEATFRTVDGKRFTKGLPITYKYEPCRLTFDAKGDSITAELEDCANISQRAHLIGLSPKGQRLVDQQVSLPFSASIQPGVKTYTLYWQDQEQKLEVESSEVEVMAYRTPDSVFALIRNPRHLPLWYELYKGPKNRIQQAQVDRLDLRFAASPKKVCFLQVSYLWKGEMVRKNYRMALNTQELLVELEVPNKIYPGEETKLGLSVADFKGKPVADADVLMYALTNKFHPQAPQPRGFNPALPNKLDYNAFHEGALRQNADEALPYPYWRERFGLDSMLGYRFLYPGNEIFRYERAAPDTVTQLMAFPMKEGQPRADYVLFIDGHPAYIPLGYPTMPRCVVVDSGWHVLNMWVKGANLLLDSVYVPEGKQVVLSVDWNQYPFRRLRDPEGITRKEAQRLVRYVMPIKAQDAVSWSSIQQGKQVFFLPRLRNSRVYGEQTLLIGPLLPRTFQFVSKPDGYTLEARHEPNYRYEFSPKLMKMKSYALTQYDFQAYMERASWEWSGEFWAIKAPYTANRITKRYYQVLASRPERKIRYDQLSTPQTGQAELYLEWSENIPNWETGLLFSENEVDFLRARKGNRGDFRNLPVGTYRYIGMRKDHHYFVIEGIPVKHDTTTYLKFPAPEWKPIDSTYRVLYSFLTKGMAVPEGGNARWHADSIRLGITDANYQSYYLTQEEEDVVPIRLRILDNEEVPLQGVAVLVKGTVNGAFTDGEGYVSLRAPLSASLVMTYIGYETLTLSVEEVWANRDQVIQLYPDEAILEEVVVTGYGGYGATPVQGATTTLSGKVAGLQIRGARSVTTQYYIDGMAADLGERIGDLNVAAAMQLTSEEEALFEDTQPYVDPENPTAPLILAPSSLRSNFRDDAYWRPRLRTDAKGKSYFTVTFPDDITRWQHFGVAYDANKHRIGLAQASTRSFQALMGRLSLPRFLVHGDSSLAFGKAQNLTGDSLNAQLRFISPDNNWQQKELTLGPYALDTLAFHAPRRGDSLSMTFRLDVPGLEFFDGEKRDLPLYPKGDRTTEGIFLAMLFDTTVSVQMPPGDEYTLEIHATQLDILEREVYYLRNYRHYCNEQLASQLRALLADKRIQEARGKSFQYEKEVAKILDRLIKNRNNRGLWGWWAGMPDNYWISQHIMESLLEAKELGYKVTLMDEALKQYLTYEVEKTERLSPERIRQLWMLYLLGAEVAYPRLITEIEADTNLSLTNRIRLMRLRQGLELPYELDSLMALSKSTVMGGLYWPDSQRKIDQGDQLATLEAYKLLRAEGGYDKEMARIRAWIFGTRGYRCWGNTYLSGNILQTLLPDVMTGENGSPRSQVHVYYAGGEDTYTSFPVEQSWDKGRIDSISMKGTLPAYVSLYGTRFDTLPLAVDSVFKVETAWGKNQRPDTVLKAGEPIDLWVSVRTEKMAEYVLIEVPIPAGCSYAEKGYRRDLYESNREQRRDRVAIYCRLLPVGTHRFKVKLQPRFPGQYTLNPARAEEMYAPTLFGRNGLKQVDIR